MINKFYRLLITRKEEINKIKINQSISRTKKENKHLFKPKLAPLTLKLNLEGEKYSKEIKF